MGPPDGLGPHDGQIPQHHVAVRVAGRKTVIAANKRGGVNLRLVAAQNIDWRWFSHDGDVL